MDFINLIKQRYSCRDFDGSFLEYKEIIKIVEDASLCASAKNTQPWQVFVTNTAEENIKIKECLQDSGKNKHLDKASAFIVIYENIPDSIECEKYGNDRFVELDCGEFLAYLTLSAKNKGIDSCIIGWVNEEKLKILTGINLICKVVVALGKSKDNTIKQKKRKKIKDIIINYKEGEQNESK